MPDPVSYTFTDGIATIVMDDGKANLMTLEMLSQISEAFHAAEADGAVTVLTGRAGVFSAGYDLAMFELTTAEVAARMQAGGELVAQILSHPLPIIAACNGHAIAQGAFTLLACDVRLGVEGDAKIGMNEVAIGLTIPHYGVELARHQLNPAWFDHATLTGTLYSPETAHVAGFFHELVERDGLALTAKALATQLRLLDAGAHAGTKERVRRHALDAIEESLTHEFVIAPT